MEAVRNRLGIWLRGLTRPHRFRKRYDLINYFIRTRDDRTYLEIGTGGGRCFERIRCASKTGVDPAPRRVLQGWNILRMTSDDFFQANTARFDVIFIDGLHTSDQAIRDIFNGLAALAEGGVLFVHDCNPATEQMQIKDPRLARDGQWSGDVWKAITYVRRFLPDLFCRVFAFDKGVGVIVPDESADRPAYTVERERQALEFFEGLSWGDLQQNRNVYLGLIETLGDFEAELRHHESVRARVR